ncbi:MAG: ETC complex I subunit [Pseudomonadota bacterium]
MQVSIFRPAKTAMQSGLRNTQQWMIEFQHDASRKKEPLMGWVSSKDTQREVRLKFLTKELAINFAKENDLSYEVMEPKEKKFIKRTYAENFK